MAEGVGNGAVEVAQEETNLLFGLLVTYALQKGLYKLVQVTQVDWIGGDAGHMAVEYLEEVEQFVKVMWWVEFQKLHALLYGFGVVWHDVSGTVGCVALVKVADSTHFEELLCTFRDGEWVEGVFSGMGQGVDFLFVGK